MSYQSVEESDFGGDPVELLEFSRGGLTYRYTSHRVAVIANGSTYSPVPMPSPKLVKSMDSDDASAEFQIPMSTSLAKHLKTTPNSATCRLTVRRKHLSDPETIVIFKGAVVGVRMGKAIMKMKVSSLLAATNATGLRRLYSRSCSHTLYGLACGLDKYDFAATAVIVGAVVGSVVTIPALGGGGEYEGGFIEWTVPVTGVSERGWVVSHGVGGVLTLSWAPVTLQAGDAVSVFQGCDRIHTTCQAKGNYLNFGGFPHMPTENPFGGTKVF